MKNEYYEEEVEATEEDLKGMLKLGALLGGFVFFILFAVLVLV